MKTEIKTMRDVYIEEIYKRMHYDDKIFFLCADFGAPKLDQLKNKFKKRLCVLACRMTLRQTNIFP